MGDIEAQLEAAPIFKKANRPVILKFENVSYKIKPTQKRRWRQNGQKSESKVLLNGVTGVVKPGELLALLGPSGSGKTTLLAALGGRLAHGKISGTITYNNKPFTNAFKRNTGFVTQDDVLYPHLTVTETLVYTALLRLPNPLTDQEKTQQAHEVITKLGLTKCKNSMIGGPLLRGISGGERKRVSIGQEMLINPSLLFLDEPTSGLDSTTAQRIVSTLSELAKGGRTIVLSIHQPSSKLFYMFHKVLLLSEGNPLYFGVGSGAMDYFAGIGHFPSVAMNPSDFLLDIANGLSSDGTQEDQTAAKKKLFDAYKKHIAPTLEFELQETNNDLTEPQESALDDKQFGPWATTWWQQFSVLLRRGLKERRHEAFSVFKVGQVLSISLLAGLLWWKTNQSPLQDQLGLLFFWAAFWSFFPLLEAIFTFPKERMMLQKERSSGMYRLSSYFLARTSSDLPMELILPTMFLTITYWMAGFKPTAHSFLFSLVVLLLSVLVSQGLGLALSALVMNTKSAATLGSVIMQYFLLTGGFYVQNIPPFISWIKYLSISYHTYKLCMGAQYKAGDMYRCGENGRFCYVSDYPLVVKVGLDGQGLSIMAVVVMLVAYRLIAYLALMRIGVGKN